MKQLPYRLTYFTAAHYFSGKNKSKNILRFGFNPVNLNLSYTVMSNNTIYMVFGGVFMLYLIISLSTRSKSKARKSRKFMEDFKRDDEKK